MDEKAAHNTALDWLNDQHASEFWCLKTLNKRLSNVTGWCYEQYLTWDKPIKCSREVTYMTFLLNVKLIFEKVKKTINQIEGIFTVRKPDRIIQHKCLVQYLQ